MLQKVTSKYFKTVPSFEYCCDEICDFSTILGHELSLCPVYLCSVHYPLSEMLGWQPLYGIGCVLISLFSSITFQRTIAMVLKTQRNQKRPKVLPVSGKMQVLDLKRAKMEKKTHAEVAKIWCKLSLLVFYWA